MANHAVGYLLGDVLITLRRYGVFELLGPEKTQQLVVEIAKRAEKQYDCQVGDMLENEGRLLGICWCCLSANGLQENGICQQCNDREREHLERLRQSKQK
jgi:recombinational DNA repair protein RecR